MKVLYDVYIVGTDNIHIPVATGLTRHEDAHEWAKKAMELPDVGCIVVKIRKSVDFKVNFNYIPPPHEARNGDKKNILNKLYVVKKD